MLRSPSRYHNRAIAIADTFILGSPVHPIEIGRELIDRQRASKQTFNLSDSAPFSHASLLCDDFVVDSFDLLVANDFPLIVTRRINASLLTYAG